MSYDFDFPPAHDGWTWSAGDPYADSTDPLDTNPRVKFRAAAANAVVERLVALLAGTGITVTFTNPNEETITAPLSTWVQDVVDRSIGLDSLFTQQTTSGTNVIGGDGAGIAAGGNFILRETGGGFSTGIPLPAVNTLPAGTLISFVYESGTNPCPLTPNGANQIDGSTDPIDILPHAWIFLVGDGTSRWASMRGANP